MINVPDMLRRLRKHTQKCDECLDSRGTSGQEGLQRTVGTWVHPAGWDVKRRPRHWGQGVPVRSLVFGYTYREQGKGDFYNEEHIFKGWDRLGLRNKPVPRH